MNCQEAWGSVSCIAETRLRTKSFQRDGCDVIHVCATEESIQQKEGTLNKPMASTVCRTRRARSRAAVSSNRGIVRRFKGATHILEQTNCTRAFPCPLGTFMYTTANCDAFENPWISVETRVLERRNRQRIDNWLSCCSCCWKLVHCWLGSGESGSSPSHLVKPELLQKKFSLDQHVQN